MPRVRMDFLDGLRGLSALYVALFHIVYFQEREGLAVSWPVSLLTRWLHFGSFAVDVFIVLSGFCLMLPVVRGGPTAMTTTAEVVDYFRRRARRILPPYYAALLASLALLGVFQLLKGRVGLQGPASTDIFNAGNLVSHFLLVHNLSEAWAWRINSPMWSVATEWQIYFVFPAVLLPVWRRFGNTTTVMVGFVLGLAPLLLFSSVGNWVWAKPWFLGSFALGMAGAAVAHSPTPASRTLFERGPWAPLALAFLAGTVVMVHYLDEYVWVADALLAASATCLVLECSRQAHARRAAPSFLLRALSSPVAMKLGAFSYSLYLVHFPIEQVFTRVLKSRHFGPEATLAINLTVGVPCLLVVAYLFHVLFERPTLRRRSVAGERHEAVVATAPR